MKYGRRSALFIGAHPDDVEVCAGGTVAKLTADRWEVTIATPNPGMTRRVEAWKAASILGATYWAWRDTYDEREVVDFLERTPFGPLNWDLIVTPSPQDSHQEHREMAELGYALNRKNDTELWHMNTGIPGGLALTPNLNHFMAFGTTEWQMKSDAIQAHASQWEKYGGWKWHDTIMARDELYGKLIGAPLAEAYERIFSVG